MAIFQFRRGDSVGDYNVHVSGRYLGYASRAHALGMVGPESPQAQWWVVGDSHRLWGPCKTRKEATGLFVKARTG